MIWTWSHFSPIISYLTYIYTFVRSLQRCCNALNAHQLFFTRPTIVIRFFFPFQFFFLLLPSFPNTPHYFHKKAWFDVDTLWPSSFLSIHPSIHTYCMYAASEQGVKGNWLWFDYQFNLSWKTEIVRVCCVGCAGWDDGIDVRVPFALCPSRIHPTNTYLSKRTTFMVVPDELNIYDVFFIIPFTNPYKNTAYFYYQLPPYAMCI